MYMKIAMRTSRRWSPEPEVSRIPASSFRRQETLGVYLVSVSIGHQADLREPDRPNRNSAKTHPYIEIWGISCVSNDIRLSSGGESPPLRQILYLIQTSSLGGTRNNAISIASNPTRQNLLANCWPGLRE